MKTLLAVPFACTALLAQALPSPVAGPAVPVAAVTGPLTGPVYDAPGDGRMWVAAPGYKASFGTDGFLFVPFLGSDAERNWPVQFSTGSATVGAARLPLAARPAVRDGDLVTVDQGGLSEVYRIGAHEIEQLFRFNELPQRGDLTVHLAVRTDLQPAVAAGGGFQFTGPRGGVRYGRATAIDADGNRLPLESQWTGSGITITVPAQFVAAAALPLWIDPVVGAIVNGQNFSTSVSYADVASAPSWNQYASTFAHQFSATDSDLYCQRYTDAMANEGNLMVLDSTLDSWARPKIAYLETAQQYLIVAGVKTNAVNDYWIGGRTVPTNTSWGNSAQLQVARAPVAGQFYAAAPDVGGDANSTGTNKWTIVWQQGAPGVNRDIYMRQMGLALSMGPITALTNTTADEALPCISRSNGIGGPTTRNWMVVWRSGSSVLNGCSLLFDGQVRTHFTAVSPAAGVVTFDVSSPTDQVAGVRNHLVVLEGGSFVTMSADVWGVLLTQSGIPVHPVTDLTVLETSLGASRNLDQFAPAVDCDGLRFTVTYVHMYSATDSDVRAMTVANLGSPAQLAVQDSTNVAASFDNEFLPSVVAVPGTPARMLVGWCKETAGGSYRAEHRLYDAMSTAGGFATRATGCGGLPIVASGLQAPGGEFTIDVQGTGLQGFVAGLPASLPILACPGCTQGVSGSTLLAGIMSVTVPMDVSFVGLTLAFQAFDFGGGPCLNAVRLSDTIDVTIR